MVTCWDISVPVFPQCDQSHYILMLIWRCSQILHNTCQELSHVVIQGTQFLLSRLYQTRNDWNQSTEGRPAPSCNIPGPEEWAKCTAIAQKRKVLQEQPLQKNSRDVCWWQSWCGCILAIVWATRKWFTWSPLPLEGCLQCGNRYVSKWIECSCVLVGLKLDLLICKSHLGLTQLDPHVWTLKTHCAFCVSVFFMHRSAASLQLSEPTLCIFYVWHFLHLCLCFVQCLTLPK